MSTPRRPGRRVPRIVSTIEALADYLDHSSSWLSPRLLKWEAMGFPVRDDELDGWDIEAVDRWIDGRSKLLAPSDRVRDEQRALEEEFGIGDHKGPVSRKKAA
jgi:hypothetical protein